MVRASPGLTSAHWRLAPAPAHPPQLQLLYPLPKPLPKLLGYHWGQLHAKNASC